MKFYIILIFVCFAVFACESGDSSTDGDVENDVTTDGDTTVDGDTTADGDTMQVDGDTTPADGDTAPVDGDTTPVDGDTAQVDGDADETAEMTESSETTENIETTETTETTEINETAETIEEVEVTENVEFELEETSEINDLDETEITEVEIEVPNLIWQNPISNPNIKKNWYDAKVYCESLVTTRTTAWRLPTVNEARSLFRGCAATELGGSCGVTDSCVNTSCYTTSCSGCEMSKGPDVSDLGCYWPTEMEGACGSIWTSSDYEDGGVLKARTVLYHYARVDAAIKTEERGIRCVRNAQ